MLNVKNLCRILRKRTILVSIIYLCIYSNLFASGKITGKVTDRDTGEPLIAVNVIIKSLGLGAATDIDGEYIIINVPPGTYDVTASYIGYESSTITNINVITNRTISVDFQLAGSSLEQKEVVVSAERPLVVTDLTASEQIIDDKFLSQAIGRSIPDVIETQAGIFQGYYRGSTQVQALYMLDNVSMNSGLFSDNYTGINTSTIQEIAVLTGGYNAEFGNARSAIINVTTKTSKVGIHGTAIARIRPAGVYHFGSYMYGQDLYDWTHFDLDYWTAQANDPNSEFYGQVPSELLSTWQKQITPNDTLKNYNKRIQYETEATIYGPITDNLSFLVSGRYVKNVNIFPQAIPYNPEFNFQGYLDYQLNSDVQFKLSVLHGGYESSGGSSSNWNSYESAQESSWYSQMEITDPYQYEKYSLLGTFLYQWPELRKWSQVSGTMTYIFNPQTFLETTLSYLHDNMDRSDRYGSVPDSLYSHEDDREKLVWYLDKGYQHAWDRTDSKVYSIKSALTSQITKNHLLKTGFEFTSYDFYENHFMVEYKGGGRENFVNKFEGQPYEGNFYVQDKMEFPGLVVNAGIRVDYFNQNRTAPKNMFDPLAYQLTTEGHNSDEPYGYPGTPETERTKLQVVVAPRIGISHPITENTVLHFSYGHFYQRPSWSKMFGFPTVSYVEDDSAALDQYGDQVTYMEEWHGYYGNPKLSFEKTIQYEIGVEHNLSNLFLIDITGYYKDGSQETGFSSITGLYPATHFANKALIISNGGFSEVRGIESKIESRANFFLNGGISHDVYWSTEGVVGYSRLYEEGSGRENIPKGNRNRNNVWSGYHKIKVWTTLAFPKDFGPEIFGFKPLGDFYTYVYFWWRSGEQYTYHGIGDVSTEPNNKTWFNYYEIDLKIAKGFEVLGKRLQLSVDIKNLLNSKFLRLLYGDDLVRWEERTDLSEEQRLPTSSFSGEPDVWSWYSYEVPPRQINFEVRFDF